MADTLSDQIAAEVARMQEEGLIPKEKPTAGQQTPQNQETAKLRINIDGQEREFDTVEQMQEYTNGMINAAREAAANALPGSRVSAEDTAKGPTLPQVALEEYVSALRRNPVEAQQLLERAQFGGNALSEVIGSLAAQIYAQNQQLAVINFRETHPDYVRSDENAAALGQVMKQYNLPFDARGLDLAYSVAVRNGMIKPADTSRNANTQEYDQEVNAPPSIGNRGSTQTSPDIDLAVENLGADELGLLIQRLETRG